MRRPAPRISNGAWRKLYHPIRCRAALRESNTCRATGQDDAEYCHHQRIGRYEDACGKQLGTEISARKSERTESMRANNSA